MFPCTERIADYGHVHNLHNSFQPSRHCDLIHGSQLFAISALLLEQRSARRRFDVYHLHGPPSRRFRERVCHSTSAEFEPSVFVRLALGRAPLHPCKPTNVIQRAPIDDV